jgi:hypothetical protein
VQREINPDGIDEEYLRCLNACFPNWGGKAVFDWVFYRELPPDPLPDRFVLTEDGKLLAGSAITYRSMRLPNGSTIRIGIMTGSWTLPAARGRGCFSRVIEESIRITKDREGSILLAFVTEENPSCRQLQKAGAALFPTSYLIADDEPGSYRDETSEERLIPNAPDDELRTSFQHWTTGRNGKCTFAYSSFDAWNRQFVLRPWETHVLQDTTGSFAVLEKHATTDRINASWGSSRERERRFLSNLRARALTEGRKVFVFSTDFDFSASCKEAGFLERPGFLTAIVTDLQRLGHALEVATLSESFENQLLADASSRWFLGGWNLQSGDRM